MLAPETLLAFLLAATLLAMTPGVDTAVVLRTALSGGARSGSIAALGIALGCLIWGVAVAVGLGTIIVASPLGFMLLKLAGAAYLAMLGLRLVLRPRTDLMFEAPSANGLVAQRAFRQGFLTNLLNPKVGLFYLTFLPQFVNPEETAGQQLLLLALIHTVVSLSWFFVLILGLTPFQKALQNSRIVKSIDQITGGVFLFFAGRLVWSD